MADPRIRQLKIKTGVIKRLAKEMVMYGKEAEMLAGRVQKMEDDKADEFNIKKQKEVLEESKMMVPDCKHRLEKARVDLENLLKECEPEAAVNTSEEFTSAKKQLAEIDEST